MKYFFQFVVILTALSGWCLSSSAQNNEQIESKLLTYVDALEKSSFRTGTDDFDTLEKENAAFKKDLLTYGRRASTLKYDFPLLGKKIIIATSKDRNLRTYSWDDQQGGSGRIYETVFQYKDATGKTHSWSTTAGGEGDVCTGFTHQIFQVDSGRGRIYLLNSTSTCSNALAYQDLSVVRIRGRNLDQKPKLIKTTKGLTNSVGFEYDFFSVVDHPERPIQLFFYDEAKRSFRFPIVLEDKQFINGGKVTDKFITYRWDGKYFRKTK